MSQEQEQAQVPEKKKPEIRSRYSLHKRRPGLNDGRALENEIKKFDYVNVKYNKNGNVYFSMFYDDDNRGDYMINIKDFKDKGGFHTYDEYIGVHKKLLDNYLNEIEPYDYSTGDQPRDERLIDQVVNVSPVVTEPDEDIDKIPINVDTLIDVIDNQIIAPMNELTKEHMTKTEFLNAIKDSTLNAYKAYVDIDRANDIVSLKLKKQELDEAGVLTSADYPEVNLDLSLKQIESIENSDKKQEEKTADIKLFVRNKIHQMEKILKSKGIDKQKPRKPVKHKALSQQQELKDLVELEHKIGLGKKK